MVDIGIKGVVTEERVVKDVFIETEYGRVPLELAIKILDKLECDYHIGLSTPIYESAVAKWLVSLDVIKEDCDYNDLYYIVSKSDFLHVKERLQELCPN